MGSLKEEGVKIQEILERIKYFELPFHKTTSLASSPSLLSNGWSLQASDGDRDMILQRRAIMEKQFTNNLTSVAFCSGPIENADLLTCISLVRESQLGALAGDLHFWNVKQLTPTCRQVHYCSNFPPPMDKRDFCILEHCGVLDDDSLVLVNYNATDGIIHSIFDTPNHKEQLKRFNESPFIHGTVFYSVYQFKKLDENTIQLNRYFNIDMKLPWLLPRFMSDKALTGVFKENIDWIRENLKQYKQVDTLPESYQQVIQSDPLYSLIKDWIGTH